MIRSFAAALREPDGSVRWWRLAAEFAVALAIVTVWPWLVVLALVALGVGP